MRAITGQDTLLVRELPRASHSARARPLGAPGLYRLLREGPHRWSWTRRAAFPQQHHVLPRGIALPVVWRIDAASAERLFLIERRPGAHTDSAPEGSPFAIETPQSSRDGAGRSPEIHHSRSALPPFHSPHRRYPAAMTQGNVCRVRVFVPRRGLHPFRRRRIAVLVWTIQTHRTESA